MKPNDVKPNDLKSTDTRATGAKPPFLIGLTGGIGSGKTTVADQFAALGVTLVDADLIAHQMTAPNGPAMPALINAFGHEIAAADGRMDRAVMREKVFKDPGARVRLESILHPMIRAESDAQVAAARSRYVMMVVPLLVETGGHKKRVQRVLVVDCPEEVQIARVMARSQLPRDQVLAIMKAQASRAQRLAAADDVVDNSGGADAIAAQVQTLHQRYLALASL
jgi:dephospho-CoA kinase